MNASDLERSTFQDKPAYRYVRAADKLPAQEAGDDPLVLVKLFNPTGGQTWYLTAYDPETRVAQGAVRLFEDPECGDFSMAEVVALRARFGLPVERDLGWTPVPLSAVVAGAAR